MQFYFFGRYQLTAMFAMSDHRRCLGRIFATVALDRTSRPARSSIAIASVLAGSTDSSIRSRQLPLGWMMQVVSTLHPRLVKRTVT
jgi:hypothetical protein